MKFAIRVAVFALLPFCLFARDINVYLRFDDRILYQTIKNFNDFLARENILSRYQISPFLKSYPLHITLFLASYPETHLEDIKKKVALIARQQKPVNVTITRIFLTPGNYVMLDLDMAKQTNGQNHPIQQLSDKMVMKLSYLRDFNATIPLWAESIPEKKKAFHLYGSPNVFFEFNPHFSLMAKNFTNLNRQAKFQKEVNQLIQKFELSPMTVTSSIIGVGYVNSFGQITKEIASYSMQGMN